MPESFQASTSAKDGGEKEVMVDLSQTHAPTSTGELSAGPAALACSPPSLPRSPEEALHSLLPHERRRSSLQPALTDSCLWFAAGAVQEHGLSKRVRGWPSNLRP